MSKVLFCDFDGCLNHNSGPRFTGKEPHCRPEDIRKMLKIDSYHVNILNRLFKAHRDISVIISSSWRDYWTAAELNDLLVNEGYIGPPISGVTPQLGSEREDEILEWIATYDVKHDSKFVILDGCFEGTYKFNLLLPHLVLTNMDVGLQDEHVDEMIRRFNEP